jgi:hypothetical protein
MLPSAAEPVPDAARITPGTSDTLWVGIKVASKPSHTVIVSDDVTN